MAEPSAMSKERTTMSARTILSTLALALGLLALTAAPAVAAQAIDTFTTESSNTQAGGHPDMTTFFTLNSPGSPESAKNVSFDAPEGIFGNPNATTQCLPVSFALDSCPTNSQVGIITVRANYEGNPYFVLGTVPIYNIEPQPDTTAMFAFKAPILEIPITIPVSVRTGSDYGLRFTVTEISQIAPLGNIKMVLWGFPALDEHDFFRFPKGTPGNPPGCPGEATAECAFPQASSDPVRPLISNPTVCTGQPLVSRLTVQTYQDPSHTTSAQTTYPATTGCEKVTFAPVLQAGPTTTETDSPSGLNLTLRSQQFLTFAASPSQIKSATVTMPEGFTINPDAADGQGACTDQEAQFGKDGPSACPDNSKIGSFDIGSPSLDGPLTGALYIGQPLPDNQYRVFMIADGFGIHAKLSASFYPDPKTGQLTMIVDDLPQVPFEEFNLHLFASDRGLMATPTACRVYTVKARFFPWDAELPDQESSQIFGLTSGPNGTGCPAQVRPFNPRLVAGTSTPVAGAYSDFHLKLDRDDGDQFLGDLNFTMPPGFTGNLRGISYCPESAIAAAAAASGRGERAAPSCPASINIGTTNVAAGPGGHPFNAAGRIYLAGPLKGAPLSLVAITPALAGPYDYGNVVVRVALHIDSLDAHVKAVSQTMPAIIGGIPIRMRSIQVNLDRPQFTINPTNCSPFSIASQGIGDQGTVSDFSSYFNAVNCSTLGFKPRMKVTQLGGRKSTARSRNPSLRFDLYSRPGDANLKSVAVTLSKAFAIDQRHLGNLCSETELVETKCAGRQAIGTASAATPLLDKPLSGTVYAVSGSGGLPKLAFILDGQVSLVPRAQSSSTRSGALKTVVPVIPDAPVGHFQVTLYGGKRGYLVNTRSLCAAPAVSKIEYIGQNGKKRTQKVRAKTACKGKGKSKRKRATRPHQR